MKGFIYFNLVKIRTLFCKTKIISKKYVEKSG